MKWTSPAVSPMQHWILLNHFSESDACNPLTPTTITCSTLTHPTVKTAACNTLLYNIKAWSLMPRTCVRFHFATH